MLFRSHVLGSDLRSFLLLKIKKILLHPYGRTKNIKKFLSKRLRMEEKKSYSRASAAINDVVNGLQSNDSFMENEQFDLPPHQLPKKN